MRLARFRRLAALIAAASALALAPAPAPVAAQSPATVAAQQAGTLPADQAPAPPRTLRAYWHVFTAFTLAWLFLFGYALSLGRRFRHLEQQVAAAEGRGPGQS